MKLAIIGAGAMGSLLGFYLCAEAEVWLLDPWQAHVDAMNAGGLVCELNGVTETRHPHVTTNPAEIGLCDAVLVLVKAAQTPWAAAQARSLCGPTTLVVTLQNGVGNREILAEQLGPEHVGQGVTALGATLLGPGMCATPAKALPYSALRPSAQAWRHWRRCLARVGCPPN